ncbi:amino acid adenylation domain-containing protein [Micromonospora sp. NPDC047134]|uniref:amino acid adenylation domain-containing protein n=1 Tax=Micromonospora sp. NPDC047134 TaxID=3154340 RepID=UPI0033E9EAB4
MSNPELPEERSGLAQLLTASAARWPDRPALTDGARTLSYAELDQAVTVAAAQLTRAGVAPGDRVGLSLGRGAEELIALAALQRLGACFVPADPAAPDARISFVLQDSGSSFVLARGDAAERFDRLPSSVRVIELERLSEPAEPAAVTADPGRLAYIIYTSGSTGTPKGVAVAAGPAAEHARLAADYFGLRPGDRLLQFASLGFDVAQEEIWPTWAAGATLVLTTGLLPAAPELATIVADHRITVLQLPTAYWRSLLACGPTMSPDAFRSVRLVVIGSEAARMADVAPWRESALAHAQLVNAYGPTEAIVTATAYRIDPTTVLPETDGGLPIGPPFPGRTARILGPDGQAVPRGAIGELHLGGLLAEGYVNRPELTAERFIRHAEGERLYRTGDLVRELDGGVLEFIGRADGQLKLRGYRIEAEEVEAALRGPDEVLAAAVALISRPQGEPVLGALLTGAAGGTCDPAEVLRTAATVLPSYMVPSFAVVVPQLPINSNGKIDRAATAAELGRQYQQRHRENAARGNDEPGTDEVVTTLLAIWRTVLGVDDLGPDEDFYDLGGDSLLAMQITARARAAGWLISPADLLAAATVNGLAALARPLDAASGPEKTGTGPIELLPAQLRWLRDGEIPDMDAFVLCALFTVPPQLDRGLLLATARLLVDRHPVLGSRFHFDGDAEQARIVEFAEESVVEVIDLVGGSAAEISVEVEQHLTGIQRSLNLVDGPVWRLVHLRAPAGPGRLFLVVHHLLLDGWSMSLLVDDLDAAVTSGLSGRMTLAESTADVRAVSAAFDRYLAGDEARRDAAAWLALPWQGVRPLPYDRQGPGTLSTVRTRTSWLGEAETEVLLHRLDRRAPRPHTLLLAAICVTLAKWSGQPVQAIDVYSHSRDAAVGGLDLSRTVGYVQATYPHVVQVQGDEVDEVLRLTTVSCGPERRYGFDALRFCSPHPAERAALAGLPASPARLNYRGQLDRIERRPETSALGEARENPGLNRSPRQTERYQLMFEGDIVDGRLLVGVKYSTDQYEQSTVEALVDGIAGLLGEVARRLAR